MVTATQFITIREQALLDLSSAVDELKARFTAGSSCDDSFNKIETIFAQVHSTAISFAKTKDTYIPKWVTGTKGKCISYSLGAAIITLILLNQALQAVQYHHDVESSPTCIKITQGFQDTYLTNVTSPMPVPDLKTICAQIEEQSGPSFSLYMLIGTAVATAMQGITLYATDRYRNAYDDYEKTKQQIENRTLISDELATFFDKFKKFDKERSKRNLKICTEALSHVANHKVASKLGTKEEFVSTLAERVEDEDFKSTLDHHRTLIEREYKLRENSPRYPKQRSRRPKKRRGERSGDLQEAEQRRLSSNPMQSEVNNELSAIMEELNIDFMRLGSFWVDKHGNIAKTELDPILHRRNSDTPVVRPFVIRI